jgi:hypothetical protein
VSPADLAIVMGAFKQAHPDLIPSIRALTTQKDNPDVSAAATVLLQGLLSVFDAGEQARWQLRDLLQRVPKTGGGYYLALKYNATEMVYRIAVCGDMDMSETTYFSTKQPPEIQNWKSDIPTR